MTKLGENRLGSFQFAQPVAFDASTSEVRDRADENVKSPFPTHEGTTWDKILTTLITSAEIQNEIVQNIIDERFVDTATQKQLGLIGELFDLERQPGEKDVHFRARIKAQLPKNTTSTTIDEILRISAQLLNTDPQRFTLIEDHDIEPARFDIHVEEIVFDDSTITVDEFETLLQDIRAAGVRANAVVGEQFTYRSVADWENGVNSVDKAYGGYKTETVDWPGGGWGEGAWGEGGWGQASEPGQLTADSVLLDVGGEYADEITQRLT